MNDSESIDLAAMLCSRLCHDMLSPVGALSNGLELLAMETDPEMRRSVIELLEQSSKTSTNKLKFFRLAFGAAGGFGDRVDVEEPKALIEALRSSDLTTRTLAIGVLKGAVACHSGMATFAEAGVAEG